MSIPHGMSRTVLLPSPLLTGFESDSPAVAKQLDGKGKQRPIFRRELLQLFTGITECGV